MLVLSRKVGQELVIGDNIRITVNRVGGSRVTLGIDAPDAVRIVRAELEPIVGSFDEEDKPSTSSQNSGSDKGQPPPAQATVVVKTLERLTDASRQLH